jgi:hypothetical protein
MVGRWWVSGMDNITTTGAYDQLGPIAQAKGWDVFPIGPGTKEPMVIGPGGECVHMYGWQQPGRSPAPHPQPGAGLGVRLGQYDNVWIIALDFDNQKVAERAISQGLLVSPLCKVGRHGFTSIYRSDKPIKSRDLRSGGRNVVQVLSTGKQTVLPPTLHPETNEPYYWLDDYELQKVRPEDVPTLPDDYEDVIKQLMSDEGFIADDKLVALAQKSDGGYKGDSPHSALNALAMQNLPKWIMQSGVARIQRMRGYNSWAGVPHWRPSTRGKPLEQRKLTLEIKSGKIKDRTTGKTYTPLDLIMAARDLSLPDAYDFLYAILHPDDAGPEIDYDALRVGAFSDAAPDDSAASSDSANGADAAEPKERDFSKLGPNWRFGEVLPARPAMLIEGIIPAKGWGYIGGQWGTYKTFFCNAIAVAVASGGTFAGQTVNKTGAVIVVELEGSDSEARITAAARAVGIDAVLPITVFSEAPHKAIVGGVANPKFKQWLDELAAYGHRFARECGVPLALIEIDPQNKIGGYKSEDSSAEMQIVADMWDYLSKKAGCAVAIVDHYGKSADSGLRGSSVKETSPLYILGLSAKKKDYKAQRLFWVRKMKNGRDGVGAHFHMEDCSVEVVRCVTDSDTTEVVTVQTLVVKWDDDLQQIEDTDDTSSDNRATRKPKKETLRDKCYRVLARLDRDESCRVKRDGTHTSHAVVESIWRFKCIEEKHIQGGKNGHAQWCHVKKDLKDDGRIDTDGTLVWLMPPEAE